MVNLKTKFDKHVNDNEKRRRSIREKEKAKSNQSQIIKQALSNSTLSSNSSKKIVFNDEDEETEFVETNYNGNNFSENGKTVLFGGSDSENEDFEIKEKSQFRGKKGFELLNLQSTYGNDERFKIDERFFEAEKQEGFNDDNNKAPDDTDTTGEKAKQLKILESVLGTPLVDPDKEKKAKKRTNVEMVRYDASNKDHEKYEINNQSETANATPSKRRKEGKKTPKTDKQELPTPKVSNEKFYEVSTEIKNRFKEKKEEGGQFSLLQTYGLNDVQEDEDIEEEDEEGVRGREEQEGGGEYSNFAEYLEEDSKNYDWNRTECKTVMDEPKVEKKPALAKGIWKESFFFDDDDDPRFKEGLEFINKKNSEEAKGAAENYDQTRKRLKEILRLHLKKQIHKKDPFRNKIGGMNKKQLGGPWSKNPRTISTRRKLPKMNPRGGL